MALYQVSRTDAPQPGEFIDALVVASGTAQARAAVLGHEGVTKENVFAQRVDVNGTGGPLLLDSNYSDEPAEYPYNAA